MSDPGPFDGLSADDIAKIDDAWDRHMQKRRVMTIRDALREHWLTGLHCDAVNKTDVATCYCTVWRSEPMPNVGAAIEAWIDHVMTFADITTFEE